MGKLRQLAAQALGITSVTDLTTEKKELEALQKRGEEVKKTAAALCEALRAYDAMYIKTQPKMPVLYRMALTWADLHEWVELNNIHEAAINTASELTAFVNRLAITRTEVDSQLKKQTGG